MDPSNVCPRSRVSSPWPHLICRHKIGNLFPNEDCTLSCTILVTWFITLPSCSICWETHLPLPGANLLTPVLLWERASHTQLCMEKSHGTVGSSWVWAEPSETSPPRNSQSIRSTWSVSLYVSSWFLPPSQNSGAFMLYAISTWCLKFGLLVILNQLQKQGHCLIQCW